MIQREIQDKLSTMILEGKLLPDTGVKVDHDGKDFVFK